MLLYLSNVEFHLCPTPENREDMLSSKSNRLTEALEEANKLFSGGKTNSVVLIRGVCLTLGQVRGGDDLQTKKGKRMKLTFKCFTGIIKVWLQ